MLCPKHLRACNATVGDGLAPEINCLTGELLKLFDMLELKTIVVVSEEYTAFIEFCYLLALLLQIDENQVELYFA